MKTASNHTSKESKVLDCDCVSEYQDKRYGKGKRLHNPRKEGKYACSVCGKVKG